MTEILREAALDYHRYPTPGKISVTPTKAMATARDLSLAYSPGVADACMAIADDPREAGNLTARSNLVAHNDHFDWRLNLPGISLAMPQLCAFPTSLLGLRFDGPVAVIAGKNSEYVAQSGRDSFQPMFSQAEVEFIDDAGHWVHADQPAAFVGSVRRLLQGDMQSSIAEQAL